MELMMSSVISYVKENAEHFPDQPAVSDTRQTVSYRELWQKSKNLASWLFAHGFSRNSNILADACADVSFAVAAMGIQLAGCVFVPVGKDISDDLVLRLAGEMQSPLYIGRKNLNGILCFSSVDVLNLPEVSTGNEAAWKFPDENDVAEILYTTGTTGKSKGVVLSHRAVFAASDNSLYVDRLNTESVYLIASPLNHINALRKLYSCFLGAAHAVLLDSFLDLKKYYEAIEKYQVNTLLLPPAAVRFLLFVSLDKLHSLAGQIKLIHTNSAPLTETDKETLHQCFPYARLIFGYGATEAGSVCSAYNYAEFPEKVNCIGKCNPHTQIMIVDEKHRKINSSKENPGFLAISGDSLMNGYWRAPDLTAEILQENILYTNDLGYIDEDGFIFMIGRKGDIINCGGLKIAPAEVENVVMQYPEISDCACFGAKDPVAGGMVHLQIVPANENSFDLNDFRRFLKNHLENHQMPRYIKCVKEIPKTPNGKIDRKNLA